MKQDSPKEERILESFAEKGALSRLGQQKSSQKDLERHVHYENRDCNGRFSKNIVLCLPLFAAVTELKEAGYGFAEPLPRKRLFFHRNAGVRPSDFDALKQGENILAVCGSNPRKPDSKEIVRWAAVNRVDWHETVPRDQASWDLMRQALLKNSLEQLDSMLRPEWYVRKWGSTPPPADLNDHLLRELVLRRIGSMDPDDLERLDVRSLSNLALYDFAQCLDTPLKQEAKRSSSQGGR